MYKKACTTTEDNPSARARPWSWLGSNTIHSLLHLPEQIPHSVLDPLRLQTDPLSARAVHAWCWPAKADVDASKIEVE